MQLGKIRYYKSSTLQQNTTYLKIKPLMSYQLDIVEG